MSQFNTRITDTAQCEPDRNPCEQAMIGLDRALNVFESLELFVWIGRAVVSVVRVCLEFCCCPFF